MGIYRNAGADIKFMCPKTINFYFTLSISASAFGKCSVHKANV